MRNSLLGLLLITTLIPPIGVQTISNSIQLIPLSAQMLTPKEKSLLLPSEQRVSGVVVDSLGHAIGGASIQNTDSRGKEVTTDASGHFGLSTRAPAFIIRKAGYDSAFVRTIGSKSVRITLQVSQHVVASCANKSSCKAIVGFGGVFCLSKVDGVEVSEQGNDVDYGLRFFSVQAKGGVKSIWHGSGPTWDWGVPSNEDVWRSVDYSEHQLMVGGHLVIDARGRTSDAEFWRYVGRLGESASYRDVDKESAALLDKVLDGVCTLENK